MKVFLSWSGERSKAIATALYEWLPLVIQEIVPWMSATDIEQGSRPMHELAEELSKAKFGIICLTPENLASSWLNFEAGAISKSVETSRVFTYLFQLENHEVKGPLSQFQHTKTDKASTQKLITDMNKHLETPLQKIDVLFNQWWPKLETSLSAIPKQHSIKATRNVEDLASEILTIVRDVAQRVPTTRELAEVPPGASRLKEILDWVSLRGLGGEVELYEKYLERELARHDKRLEIATRSGSEDDLIALESEARRHLNVVEGIEKEMGSGMFSTEMKLQFRYIAAKASSELAKLKRNKNKSATSSKGRG